MYFLDNNSGVSTMPPVGEVASTTPRWFTETPPSYPGADWFNIVQGELINVITGSDSQLEKGNLNQLSTIINSKVAKSDIGNEAGQIPDMSYFSSGGNWSRLPNGVIFQRGISQAGSVGAPSVINFPIAFTSTAYTVVACYDNARTGVTSIFTYATTPVTNSSFALMSSSPSPSTFCHWIAFGK